MSTNQTTRSDETNTNTPDERATRLTLYGHEVSGHAHRAQLMLHLLGLPHEVVRVDLMRREHKAPAFLTKNPFGQVPVLEDGEVTLGDSSAILVYLATRYDAARRWLPTDAVVAARVQRWLSVASNEVVRGPGAARLVKLLGAAHDLGAAQAVALHLYTIMDAQLASADWLATDHPTIADVAMYSYTAVAHEGGVSLAPHPHVRAWMERVRALPGFVEMTIQSADT